MIFNPTGSLKASKSKDDDGEWEDLAKEFEDDSDDLEDSNVGRESMTFDESSIGGSSPSPYGKRRYVILVDNNYIAKPLVFTDTPGQEGRQRKDMKNQDFKVHGLFFRVCITGGSRRVVCERRYKDFEFLR